MKTPRQILLDQHRNVEPALEQIQAQVLAECLHRSTQQRHSKPKSGPMKVLRTLWIELILPVRAAWSGFALVWLALIGINLADQDHQTISVETKSTSAQQLILWKERQALLTELTAPATLHPADRPKPSVPQPRSNNETPYLIG